MVANPPKADPESRFGSHEATEPGVDPVIEHWLRNEVVRTNERVQADPEGMLFSVEETYSQLHAHMDQTGRKTKH